MSRDARFGWRLEVYDELPSTSDAVLARVGEPAGLAVLALRQTRGRGSHGRRWRAPAGNLNLSVLLRPTHQCPWSLLAGVAVHQAIAGLLPFPAPLTLKWPNDLLLNGGKLAGVLVESGAGWLVIGIGLNLREAPSLPDRSTAALSDLIAPPPVRQAAEVILASLRFWLDIEQAEGFAPIRDAWLTAAHPYGTHLRVDQGGTLIEGAFAGLSDNGALLLESSAGLRPLHAGTVI